VVTRLILHQNFMQVPNERKRRFKAVLISGVV
jgi:hypothetical protein